MTSSFRYVGSNPSTTTNEVTAERRSYLYDPIGNRKAAYVGSSLSMNPAYTANSLNQYTATVNPSESFTYDEDGNMTEDGTFDYTWNGENRLLQVAPGTATTNDLRLTFTYDYMGRRVQKVEEAYDGSSWSTNAVTKFVWDGWLLIAELDGTDSDALTRTHTWGLDLSGTLQGAGGISGLLMVDDDTGDGFCGYYAYDGNGNVGQVLDADDLSTDAHYEYDPYGREIVASGTYADDNPWRFSTKYLDVLDPNDDDASLLYFGFRYLSPRLGRWMSRDPLGEDGGPNLLLFASSDPVNAVDPKGRSLITSPYCCPEDDPTLPEKSCEEICQIARDRGVAGDVRGTVICHGHNKKCPCLIYFDDLDTGIGDCPEIEAVMLEHERRHIPQTLPCNKCGIYPPGAIPPDDWSWGNEHIECPAHWKSYHEMLPVWRSLDAEDPCFDTGLTILNETAIYLNIHCPDYPWLTVTQ